MISFWFDIETGPLPQAELEATLKPFDPKNVKLGNLKDPEKIKAKIEEAEADHRRKHFDDAALDPLTGEVLCIGVLDDKGNYLTYTNDQGEGAMILRFWNLFNTADHRGNMQGVQLFGWNIFEFDLPFLVRRGWRNGIPKPSQFRCRGKYIDWSQCTDVFAEWQLGQWEKRWGLDSVSKFFGSHGKNGHGADFYKVWATDRPKALAYVENDVRELKLISDRIIVNY